MRFWASQPDVVRSRITVADEYAGVGAVVHGGIIATMFDDVMMWCLLRHRRRFFLTTEMSQQLHRPTPTRVPLLVEAAIDGERDGRVHLATRLTAESDGDVVLARGTGTFAPIPDRLLGMIPAAQRAEMESLFDRFAAEDATG